MNIKLTKDADKVICALYTEYKNRCKNGELEFEARCFGDSKDIKSSYLPKMPESRIDAAIAVLCGNGLYTAVYGDDAPLFGCLSDSGIIYMENRVGDFLNRMLAKLSILRTIFFG